MRLQIKLISMIGIFFTIVDARANYTYLNNRPVIDLNDKPRPTTILKLPHERRSSMFPKAHLRFVSDTKESQNVSPHSTKEKSWHNPVTQSRSFRPKEEEMNSTENVRSKLPSLAPKILETNTPRNNVVRNRVITTELKSMNINQPIENHLRNNSNVRKTENESDLPMKRNQRKRVNTPAMTTELKSMKINQPIESDLRNDSNARKTENASDLPIKRNQRKRVSTIAIPDTEDVLNKKQNIMPAQIYDTKEDDYFSIFKLPTISLPPNGNNYEESIAGRSGRDDELQWTRNRRIRSVNIIEEENLGTTIQSGFKFTGREPRVISHQGFRNINS